MTLALDSSGFVWLQHGQLANTYWEDLDAFTQGYVDAAFDAGWDWPSTSVPSPRGFSDLAPATLAAMMGDCRYVIQTELGFDRHVRDNQGEGADLWKRRQERGAFGLSPLTLYLGDDGLIYQRVAA